MSANSCSYFKTLWWLQPVSSSIVTFEIWPKEKNEIKEQVEGFTFKSTVCNISPPGRKVNCKFPPQHLSLTMMSCLPWNSSPPEAKVPHIHELPKAARKQVPHRERDVRPVFLNTSFLMQAELLLLFCRRRSFCGSPWQGVHCRLHPQQMEFKCPEHHWKIRQTEGFAFQRRGSEADECCIWITAGPLLPIRSGAFWALRDPDPKQNWLFSKLAEYS